MKKVLSLSLLLVMVLIVLVGCSNEAPQSTSTTMTTEEPTSAPTATPKTDKIADILEEINGCKRFKITRTEFIEKYDEIMHKLDSDEWGTDLSSAPIDGINTREELENSGVTNMFPNAYKCYGYDTTYYAGSSYPRQMKWITIYVDNEDYVVAIMISRTSSAMSTDRAKNYFVHFECKAAYMALLSETEEQVGDKLYDAWYSGKGINVGHYEYGFFQNDDSSYNFVIRPIN